MKLWIVPVAIALFGLTSCVKKVEEAAPAAELIKGAPHGRGRFVGVGIYSPGRLWEQIAAAQSSAAKPDPSAQPRPAAATLADDDEIIVILDSSTGELRQCGNLSGVCIGMNPWSKALATGLVAPAVLAKGSEVLDHEADAAASKKP